MEIVNNRFIKSLSKLMWLFRFISIGQLKFSSRIYFSGHIFVNVNTNNPFIVYINHCFIILN